MSYTFNSKNTVRKNIKQLAKPALIVINRIYLMKRDK